MTSTLNQGGGICLGSARLLIKPIKAVIELGALQDVISMTLNCVHHSNRTGDVRDFIAVALPQMHKGRNFMQLGHDIELIGSESSLSRLNEMDGIAILRRRGMIEFFEITETFLEPGVTGAAYIRDRVVEKHTAGWIRRTNNRAERRGKKVGKPIRLIRERDPNTLALFYGDATVHVREFVSNTSENLLFVSTYGFSSSASPAILPVLPDSVRFAANAD
jgi:hypothetical protein